MDVFFFVSCIAFWVFLAWWWFQGRKVTLMIAPDAALGPLMSDTIRTSAPSIIAQVRPSDGQS
jgi:hypothetical protein